MAIVPGLSSNGLQAPGAAYEVCYNEQTQLMTGQPPVAAPDGDGSDIEALTWTAHSILSVRCIRLGNATAAPAPAVFRINGQDDSVTLVEAGSSTLVKVSGRITKLEVKGAGASAYWNPAIF